MLTSVVTDGGAGAVKDHVELVGALGTAALLAIGRQMHDRYVDGSLVQLELGHDHPLVWRVLVLNQPDGQHNVDQFDRPRRPANS
jgi:hypothetical protein